LTSKGNLFSTCSLGPLWVSPSFMHTVTLTPSFVVLGTPAASDQAAQVNPQLAVARVDAVDVGDDQVGMVAGNHTLGDGTGPRL
jgi:hypothetical protein